MSSIENDCDNLTPLVEQHVVEGDATPKDIPLSIDVTSARKRSAPASSRCVSPALKKYSSGESSNVTTSPGLNSKNNLDTRFPIPTVEAKTPTSRRSFIRSHSNLCKEVLKQRTQVFKSPVVKPPCDINDQDIGDDDVFLPNDEPESPGPSRGFVVNLSPIVPIDCYNADNAHMASKTRRSNVEGWTPKRRSKVGFEPSDSSTPSRNNLLPSHLNEKSPDIAEHLQQIRPVVPSTSFTKSFSMSKLDFRNDSLWDRQDHHIYRLQPTTEDRITVERCPIAGGTLRDLLESKTGDTFNKEFILIDARYPYEYNGGHIRHAINAYDTSKIGDMFFPENEEAFKLMKSRIPIFYCEYSQARGPGMIAALRRLDRGRNIENYPNLDYPELYLLFGGYKSFYREFKKQNYCVPDKYVPMNHKKYKTELKKYNNHKSVHTQMKAKLVQKAGFHVKNRVFRQSFSSSQPKTPSSSDETKCEDSKTPRKGAKSELLHGVLEHAVGERSFLSVSQAKRYHDFDTTVEASDIESFVMSPSRPDRSVLPAASNKCPFDKSADEDASNLDQNDADNEDSTEGIQDLSDDGVQPIQLSFSSCL